MEGHEGAQIMTELLLKDVDITGAINESDKTTL